MQETEKILGELKQYIGEMLVVLEEGRESASEYIIRIDALVQILDSIFKIVPNKILSEYSEFFTSFRGFCVLCKQEDFLVENVDDMAASLGLFEECIEQIATTCKTKIHTCACCGTQVIYDPLPVYYDEMRKRSGAEKMAVSETLNKEEYLCPVCSCSDRDRMIVSFLKKINLQKCAEGARVLQIAPAASIDKWIQIKCPHVNYETTDLYMDNVSFQSDIQDLKEIEDETYDLIICSHVLEHVSDDRKAMAAMKRVLKKDGRIAFLVPIDLSRTEIDEEWGCSKEENWRRFGQDDHCRAYSKKGLIERLSEFFYIHSLGKEYFGEEIFRECGLTDTSTLYVLTKDKNTSLDMEHVITIDNNLCENGPLVSVIMSAYNHEAFVAQAIESVIGQSYKNIEFIVADDASTDGTADVMRKYSKYYQKEFYFEQNRGGRVTDLSKYAKGKYVALMNSDDIWESDKIATQVQYLEEHPDCGVCLTWCRYVGADLNPIDDDTFIQRNRTQTEWMNFFWHHDNALCNPSSLARAEFFYRDLPYGIASRQIPDLFRWVDIVQKTNIHIIPKTMIYMRRFVNYGYENTSAYNKKNVVRHNVERGLNWLWVIRDMDEAFFKKAFADDMINKDASTKEEIKMEKYFLMLNARDEFRQNSALYYFCEIYAEVKDVMVEKYGYTRNSFWNDEIEKGLGKFFLYDK